MNEAERSRGSRRARARAGWIDVTNDAKLTEDVVNLYSANAM